MTTTPIPHRWSIVVRGDKTPVASVQSDGVLLGSEAAINDAEGWLVMFAGSEATAGARATLKVWQDATNLDTFSWTATPAEILDEIDFMRDAIAYARHEQADR